VTSVSVVIPCYNYGHFLDDAVASVLDDQDGVEVRVLIIDDASPDGSGDVARAIAARDDRVAAIVHPANRGHIATYNEGLLDWAEGDYCVLMSADDRLTPGSLRRATDLLDANPGVGFVYGSVVWFRDGTRPPAAQTSVRGWSVWPGEVWLERRFRRLTSEIWSPEVVVRTSVQKHVGGYDARLPHLADVQMWARLAAVADVGYLRGAEQAYYRRHDRNMSTALDPHVAGGAGAVALPTLREYRLVYETVLEESGDLLSDASRLSGLVHRKLAREALLAAVRAYDCGQTELTPVDELQAFALECCPAATTTSAYRSLQLRRRLGPQLAPRLQPLGLPAVTARRAAGWWRKLTEGGATDTVRSAVRRRVAARASA